MRVSYSRIGSYEKCPYQFRLKYVDGLKPNRPAEAADPLVIGKAMHEGIEKGVDHGIKYYQSQVPVYDDACVHEEIKLRALIPKVRGLLPEGCQFEFELKAHEFLGFIDLLVPTGEPDEWDMYDFKYTNPKNGKRYQDGEQLQVYKYYFEALGHGTIRNMWYTIVPKTAIRQKKTETLKQFRNRLETTLRDMEPVNVRAEERFPQDFFRNALRALTAEEFIKCPSNLCDWCDYKDYCFSDGKDLTMTLPDTARRDVSQLKNVKMWIYGEPFTGKTTFANAFPTPLMLNTDGNIKFVDAPYIALKDTVEVDGRLTKSVHGWETLEDAVTDLEKGSDFDTVVLDLVEGAYELNRSYIYEKRGWEHESDDSFKAWDIVRKNFFDLMRRITNLPMNVILISHEDTSRDFTARNGNTITAIKPNLADKVAKVVAGMVDIVGRAIVVGDDYRLTFKTEEFVFGGGRLDLEEHEISLDFTEFCDLIGLDLSEPTKKTATRKAVPPAEPAEEDEPAEEETATEEPSEEDETPEAPKPRRGRPRKVVDAAEAVADMTEEVAEEAAPVKRTRKRRTAE